MQKSSLPNKVLGKIDPRLKDILPRHLRKPFRLLNQVHLAQIIAMMWILRMIILQANNGDYEQHLNAVRELSK